MPALSMFIAIVHIISAGPHTSKARFSTLMTDAQQPLQLYHLMEFFPQARLTSKIALAMIGLSEVTYQSLAKGCINLEDLGQVCLGILITDSLQQHRLLCETFAPGAKCTDIAAFSGNVWKLRHKLRVTMK